MPHCIEVLTLRARARILADVIDSEELNLSLYLFYGHEFDLDIPSVTQGTFYAQLRMVVAAGVTQLVPVYQAITPLTMAMSPAAGLGQAN